MSDLADADPNDGVIDVDLARADEQISLRAAVDAANASPEDDLIILPEGVFELTLENGINLDFVGDLDVGNANDPAGLLFVRGAGQHATVISSSTRDPERVFDIMPGASLHLSELTVRNGRQDSGGNIRNMGELTLEHVSVTNGFAFHQGGGIQNLGGTVTIMSSELRDSRSQEIGGGLSNVDGLVTIIDSTVSSNEANLTGGGLSTRSGSVQIISSTFDSNVSGDKGGGIAIQSEASLFLHNSTLSGNKAIDGAGVYIEPASESVEIVHSTLVRNVGSGISTTERPPTLSHTVVAQNIIEDGRSPGDVQGIIMSGGHNLIGDGTNLTIRNDIATDLIGDAAAPIDALLNPLQNNGGLTNTHLPRAGSPLIDAGAGQALLETDQRGRPRPFDANDDGVARSDIGAVEFGGVRETSDYYVVFEDSLLIASPGVLANDTDTGFQSDSLQAVLASMPSEGTLLQFNKDGTFRYQPRANFTGFDEFTYVVQDGDVTSEPVLVAIFVFPVNDPPTAVDDAYAVNEDEELRVRSAEGLLQNDEDVDGNTLRVSTTDDPMNGTLQWEADGSFVYMPNENFHGTDTFSYTVTDGQDRSTAKATITVVPKVTLLAQLSGTNWRDLNANGVRDTDDSGLEQRTILLLDFDTGLRLNDTTTNFNGDYEFLVPTGRYIIEQVPTGLEQTFPLGRFDTVEPVGNQAPQRELVTRDVVAADFNNDGHPDLATVNDISNTVSVRLSDGNGGFDPPTLIDLEERPTVLVALDVDGDLDQDLAVMTIGRPEQSPPSGSFLVLLQNDGGHFSRRSTLSVDSGPIDVVSADFDGDRTQDLAVVSFRQRTVTIFKNASGVFSASGSFNFNSNPTRIEAIHINNDAAIDLVVAEQDSDDLTVLSNDGNGNFVASMLPSAVRVPSDLRSADLNRDGRDDLIVVGFASDTLSIFVSDGSSNLSAIQPETMPLRQGTSSDATEDGFWGKIVQVADVNADMAPDLIVIGEPNVALTLFNRGNGEFAPAVYFETEVGPPAVAIADLDHDGDLDVATTSLAAGVTTLRNAIGRYEVIVEFPGQNQSGFDFGNLPLESVGPAAALPDFAAYDVNLDGTVSARDVLSIINAINNRSSTTKTAHRTLDANYDVNGDGFLSSIDAMLVINFLNDGAPN